MSAFGDMVRVLRPLRPNALTDNVARLHAWADTHDDVGVALATCPRVGWLLTIGDALAKRGLVDGVPTHGEYNDAGEAAWGAAWDSCGEHASRHQRAAAAKAAADAHDVAYLARAQQELAPRLAAALRAMEVQS